MIMAFFGDFSKKISATSQTVVQKAKGMADISNLKSSISDEQKKIDKYYQSLGKLYYELKGNTPEPELEELVAMIRSSYFRIDEINASITAIENIKTCPVCGTPLENDMVFCVGCGTRIENPDAEPRNPEMPETKFCINCGSKIPRAASFCTKCGAKQG